MRCLVHQAATIEDVGDDQTSVVMVNDVARAIFEASAVSQVIVEPPDEDKTESEFLKDQVCRLKKSLHGTRDGAMIWEEGVAKDMSM